MDALDTCNIGYHGTDWDSATKIREVGFRPGADLFEDGCHKIYFGVGDEGLALARLYGKQRARERGVGGFAVLRVANMPDDSLGAFGEGVGLTPQKLEQAGVSILSVIFTPLQSERPPDIGAFGDDEEGYDY